MIAWMRAVRLWEDLAVQAAYYALNIY